MADASIQHRPDRARPWRVRYRDPDGRQRSRSFKLKRDAQRFRADTIADMSRGSYIDPSAGRVTFAEHAQAWLDAQTSDVSTREAVASRLRVHILPHIGDLPVNTIRPSTLQAWLRGRADVLAPATVHAVLQTVSTILAACVEDGLIPRNPAASKAVRAPARDRRRIVPWTAEQVHHVIDAHPARWQAVPVLAAGCGLRQGETFGVAVDDVAFLHRQVHVQAQVKLVHGRPVFARPKGGATREVPLSDATADALAEHIRQWPPVDVTLPWGDVDGEPTTRRLVFATRQGGPLTRSHWNRNLWKPALVAAGVDPTRSNGMHALRHFYASSLLSQGVSIRAVAQYLGHADPAFTLRVYSHLMPDDDGRARVAIDAVLARDVAQMWPQAADER